MTDKEKTLAFIEERIKWNEDMMQRDPKPSDIGRIEEAKCIRRFIDSLQEEPVSEDLEEALEEFIDSIMGHIEFNSATPFAAEYVVKLLEEAFKAGAKWKEQQMIKDAVDACVTDIRTYKKENEVDFTVMYEKGIIPYEIEQEVKLIVIKEECI